MKRILVLVLVLCMLASITPLSARAEEMATFSVGESKMIALDYPTMEPDALTNVEISKAGECVYLCFTPEYTESYTFYSLADDDTYGYLYDNEMNQLASNDDGGEDSNFSVTYTLEAGRTYVYAAKFYNSSTTGSFDVMLKANHEGEGDIVTPSTCSEDGVMGHICSACGQYYTSVIPAAHTWDEGQVTQEPTCTEDGILLYTCTVCAETYTESIDGDHSFADGVCAVCGIDRRMYADGDYTAEITKGGAEAYFWFTPEYTDSYSLSAPEYASGNWLGEIRLYDSNMNCLLNDNNSPGEGLSVTYKLEAGKTYIWGISFYHSNTTGTVTVTLQTNHRPSSNTVITPATCTEDGLMSCICEVCSRVYTEVSPAAHRPQNGVCIDCGHVMDVLGSGSCGENVSWILDETGTITISGIGAMTDYESGSDVPWESLRDNITSVVVADGVTNVGDYAFYYCTQITSAFIGDDVTEIGDAAFCSCGKLVDLAIGQNVERIGSSAFSDCVMLYDVQLPDSLLGLASCAFMACSSIEQIELPDSLVYISGEAFWGCKGLTSIVIPDSVTSVGKDAFYGCTRMESITLPDSITYLGEFVFSSCSRLTSIKIPNSMSSIPYGMFWNCTSLADVTIPDSVIQIGQAAFSDCISLEEIVIPNSVTSIGYESFYNCSALRSITIPASITNIADYAFSRCTNLGRIIFTGDVPSIGDSSLYLVTATCYYPASNITWTEDVMQNYGGTITWAPYKVYAVLPDSETTVTTGKNENAAIHVDGALSDFVAVYVDGEEVDAANYTLTEGSTIVTFSAEYLESLSVGKHSVAIEFTDGYADVEITVSEPSPCDDGHTEELIPGKAPTCTETGLTEGKKCSVCGEIITAQQTIPASGHDFEDGNCTVCGEADPDYVEPEKPTDPEEPTDPVIPDDPALSGVIRIAGDDRIETSLMLADQLKEVQGVEKFDAVVVASALNFPDALTGSYLAAEKNAPILLTYPAAHAKIRAYIQENLKPGGMVYILGGEGAVSADFANGLDGFHIKRLAGSDRFGTNLAIMEEAGVSADQPVLIATAVNFADSLSASAAGLPMVLVYGSLREDQKEFLATTSRNFIIIGGEAAVSKSMENELAAIGSVTRVAGSSRYETSVLVAERFVQNPDAVILAYARNFPDGLCGGPLAYALGAPLILTDNSGYSTADTYVSGISAGIVVGGAGLISDETANQIFDK